MLQDVIKRPFLLKFAPLRANVLTGLEVSQFIARGKWAASNVQQAGKIACKLAVLEYEPVTTSDVLQKYGSMVSEAVQV